MRLRNIPGAKDAIWIVMWVMMSRMRLKGKWNERFWM